MRGAVDRRAHLTFPDACVCLFHSGNATGSPKQAASLGAAAKDGLLDKIIVLTSIISLGFWADTSSYSRSIFVGKGGGGNGPPHNSAITSALELSN